MTGLKSNFSGNMASGLADTGQDVEVWHGYIVFFSAIAFFQGLNYVVMRCGNPKAVRSDVDPWRWRNLFISWVHAAIVGVWDILWYVITEKPRRQKIMKTKW